MNISELKTVDLNPFAKLAYEGTEIAFESKKSKEYYRILRSDNDSNYNNLQKELDYLTEIGFPFLDKRNIFVGTRRDEVNYLLKRELL